MGALTPRERRRVRRGVLRAHAGALVGALVLAGILGGLVAALLDTILGGHTADWVGTTVIVAAIGTALQWVERRWVGPEVERAERTARRVD